MDSARTEAFAKLYAIELAKFYDRHPGEWAGIQREDLPQIAIKMTRSMAKRTAQVSAQAKRAAKRLGIKPTIAGIYEWLKGGSDV